jgi:hypothetical protein
VNGTNFLRYFDKLSTTLLRDFGVRLRRELSRMLSRTAQSNAQEPRNFTNWCWLSKRVILRLTTATGYLNWLLSTNQQGYRDRISGVRQLLCCQENANFTACPVQRGIKTPACFGQELREWVSAFGVRLFGIITWLKDNK